MHCRLFVQHEHYRQIENRAMSEIKMIIHMSVCVCVCVCISIYLMWFYQYPETIQYERDVASLLYRGYDGYPVNIRKPGETDSSILWDPLTSTERGGGWSKRVWHTAGFNGGSGWVLDSPSTCIIYIYIAGNPYITNPPTSSNRGWIWEQNFIEYSNDWSSII